MPIGGLILGLAIVWATIEALALFLGEPVAVQLAIGLGAFFS